ncbi:hypothetical protein [Nocardioides sp. GCM10030258]|uniref:hypothetical protein n=1 Tax=unclassified Nocardioides TaxID=2615069 RepID=UPI003612D80D
MDHDEHLRLLGEATGRSQQLELCTAQVLARALLVSESTARLLASKMGQGAILQVLTELAARRDCGRLDPVVLSSWVAVARTANKARNRVVHSPWVMDQDANGVSILVNGSMKAIPRSHEDLRQDVADLASAVTGAASLL